MQGWRGSHCCTRETQVLAVESNSVMYTWGGGSGCVRTGFSNSGVLSEQAGLSFLSPAQPGQAEPQAQPCEGSTNTAGFCWCTSLLAAAHEALWYSSSCPSWFKFIPGNSTAVEKDSLSRGLRSKPVKALKRKKSESERCPCDCFQRGIVVLSSAP